MSATATLLGVGSAFTSGAIHGLLHEENPTLWWGFVGGFFACSISSSAEFDLVPDIGLSPWWLGGIVTLGVFVGGWVGAKRLHARLWGGDPE